MAGPLDRDGWVKSYEEVEFDLPITMGERHPMLPPKSHPKDVSAPSSPTFLWPTTTTSTESRLPKSSSTSALPHGDPPQLAGVLTLSTLAIPSLAASGKPLPVDSPSGTGMPTADLFSFPGQPLTPQSPPPSQPQQQQHPSLAPPGSAPIARIPRSLSSPKAFPSSPLKHQHTTSASMPFSPFTRPGSRTSANFSRIASEEARAFGSGTLPTTNLPGGVLGSSNPPTSNRASMILYRKADPFSSSHAINLSNPDSGANTPVFNSRAQSLRGISAVEDGFLPPPTFSHRHRDSMCSTSGDSIVSLSSDSKYPLPSTASERGFIAYSFDPAEEDDSIEDDEIDWLHDPELTIAAKLASNAPGRSRINPKRSHSSSLSWRGFINYGMLFLLFIAILALFVAYPTFRTITENGKNRLIAFNTKINSTGQATDDPFDDPGTGSGGGSSSSSISSTSASASTTSTTSSRTTTTTSTSTTSSTAADSTDTAQIRRGLLWDPLWMPNGAGVEKESWAKRSENVNSFEPSGAALRKRGVVWDPVSKLWVLEGEDEGDFFEKDPWAKRDEIENSFEPSGAAPLLHKRGPGVVWDPVLKLWVLGGDENEGDFFEKDPWGKRSEAENSLERDSWAKRDSFERRQLERNGIPER